MPALPVPRRRAAALGALLLAGVAALAGCTSRTAAGGGGHAAATTTATLAAAEPGARARTPDAATVLLDQPTPAALAGAASGALLDAARIVVVAPADDAAAVARAAQQAERLHAPVLLAAADTGPVRAELQRLGARTVLWAGAGAPPADLAGDAAVTSRTDDLPPSPAPLPGVAVLVPAAPGPDLAPAVTAATATAHAAGAAVVPVAGDDPRADPAAVTALARQKPAHVVAVGAAFGPADRLAARTATAGTGAQLPGGGQVVFPGRRFVALYGHPGTGSLGALGQQDLPASIARARTVAAGYAPLSDVPVVPTFEVIATVAQGDPGPDGDYSAESSVAELRPWVEEAVRQGFYVVLDLQPGRADLLAQAELYAPLLALPSVGLGLDPEWKLRPGQAPLEQIGGVDVGEVNAVTRWLSDLTAQQHLPQKLLVVHQFRLSMIRGEQALDRGTDAVAVLVHVDGQGPVGDKQATWDAVTRAVPPGIPMGWKNFYVKDPQTMTPAATMAERPTPLMISYQ